MALAVVGLGCMRDTDIPALQRGKLHGVVDTQGHIPASGNTVALVASDGSRTQQVTDANGGFAFSDVAPGVYFLDVELPGFAPMMFPNVKVAGGQDFAAGKLSPAWLGGTASEGVVSGMVVVSGGGTPEGGQVTFVLQPVNQKVAQAAIAADGSFVQRLPPGVYDLTASNPLYVTATVTGVSVGSGATVDLTSQPISMALNPATLNGSVLEEVDGASPVPAAGALITLGNGATTTTDSAGNFSLQGLPAGVESVRVTLAGFHDTGTRSVTLQPGQTSALDPVTVQLDRGSIVGTVVVADHQSLSGTTVALTGTTYAATVAPDPSNPWQGTFQIANVPVGTYEVSASKSGYARAIASTVGVGTSGATSVGTLTLTLLQGGFSIVGNPSTPGYANSTAVTLNLSSFSSPATYRASEDPTFSGVPFTTFTATPAFPLSNREGTHTVYAQYVDGTGNTSPVFSASIVLDSSAPANPQLAINGGAAFTNVANPLVLTLQADDPIGAGVDTVSGISQVLINETGATSGGRLVATPQPYNRTIGYTRTGSGDGSQPIYVQFLDRAGNASAVVNASIVVDTTAPTGGLSISDGAGSTSPGFTRSPLVTLNETSAAEPNGGYVLVKLANSQSALAGAVLQPVSATSTWVLDGSVDGVKTVYAIFQDAAGNTSQMLSASITYDASAPSPATASLFSAPVTKTASATINVSATDASPLSPTQAVTASEDPLFQTGLTGPSPMPVSGQITVPLSSGDGLKRVYVRFRDAAGNDATTSVTVTLKQTPPSATLAVVGTLADGTTSSTETSSTTISATIATAGGATGYLLGTEALTTCPAAGYTNLATPTVTVPFTLSATQGARVVKVCVIDAAGNKAGPIAINPTITLDTSDPTGCALALDGTKVDGSPAPAGKTASASVSATLTCSGEVPTEMYLANGTVACSPTAPLAWVPFNAQSAFLLSGADGSKPVNGCVRDAAHRTSAVSSASILLQTTPPSAPLLSLDNGALYVNSTQVGQRGGLIASASGSASGAVEWALSEGDPSGGPFQPLAGAQDYFFGGTGQRTLHAVFRDDVGNLSAVASASITFDIDPPSVSGSSVSVVSPTGNGFTNSVSSTVQIVAPADATQMYLVQEASAGTCQVSDFNGAALQPVLSAVTFLLPSGDGLKGVCAEFLDAAGNVSGSVQGTIALDGTPPSAPVILSPAPGYTNQRTAAVNISSSIDPPPASSSVTYECLGGQYTDWTQCGTGSTTLFNFTLQPNVETALSIRAADAAGNRSAAASIHLTSLPFPPAPPAITRVKSTASSIALNWTSTTGAVSYLVNYGLSAVRTDGVGAAEGSSPVDAAAATNLQLSGLTANTSYYVSVQAVDAAGNVSIPSAPVLARTQNLTPRVLSVWGSDFMTFGTNSSTTAPKGYVAQRQGVVQLDLSSDSVSTVTGRATLPGVTPLGLPMPVQSCTYGGHNGDCVYVPTTTAVYVVFFDTSTPNPMTLGVPVSSVKIASNNSAPNGVTASGGFLYVGSNRRVQAFDIRNPSQPVQVADVYLQDLDNNFGMGVVNNKLYITLYGSSFPSVLELYGYDVSNIAQGQMPLVASAALDIHGSGPPAYTIGPKAAYTASGVYLVYQYSGHEEIAYYGAPTGNFNPAWGGTFPAQQVMTVDPASTWGGASLFASATHLYAFSSSAGYSVPTSLAPGSQVALPGANSAYAGAAYTKSGVDHLAVINSNNAVDRWSDGPPTHLTAAAYAEPVPQMIFDWDDYVVGISIFSGTYQTLDVSNPLATTRVQSGSLHSAGYRTGTLHGRYLFLAPSSGAGVESYRINTDGSLTYLTTVDNTFDQALAVSGKYLFVGMDLNGAGVKIFDVSNPAAPVAVTVATGAVTENVSGLAVRNRTVYVVNRAGTFHVYKYDPTGSGTWTSVATAAPPTSLNSGSGFDFAQWVSVSGDVAAVSAVSKSFVVRLTPTTATYDAAPFGVGGQTLLEGGYVVGNEAYPATAGTANDGLTFAILSPGGLEGSPDGTVPTIGCSVQQAGRTLAQAHGVYVQASTTYGVQLLTAADPLGGHRVQQYAGNWAAGGSIISNRPLATDGNYLYLGANNLGSDGVTSLWAENLETLSTSVPPLPVQRDVNSGPALFGTPRFAFQRDGTLFMLEDQSNTPYIGTYDVSDPESSPYPYIGWTSLNGGPSTTYSTPPTDDGQVMYVPFDANGATPGGITELTMWNDHLMGATSTTVAAFNLATTSQRFSSLKVYRGILYAGVYNPSGDGFIRVFDVTTPSAPVELTQFSLRGNQFFSPPSQAIDIQLSGRSIFYGGSYGSGPAAFFFAGRLGPNRDGTGSQTEYTSFYNGFNSGGDMTVVGDTLYSRVNNGLTTFDLHPWWTTAQVTNLPDPPTFLNTEGDSGQYSSTYAPLIIDGPWASLLSQDLRVFDLR